MVRLIVATTVHMAKLFTEDRKLPMTDGTNTHTHTLPASLGAWSTWAGSHWRPDMARGVRQSVRSFACGHSLLNTHQRRQQAAGMHVCLDSSQSSSTDFSIFFPSFLVWAAYLLGAVKGAIHLLHNEMWMTICCELRALSDWDICFQLAVTIECAHVLAGKGYTVKLARVPDDLMKWCRSSNLSAEKWLEL